MSVTGTSTNYAGRQVDLELLQSVLSPGEIQQVYIGTVGAAPKIVAGPQKAVQRYTVLLLSTADNIRFAADQGNILLVSIAAGAIPNSGYLGHLFGVANAQVLRQLAVDDSEVETYGTIPDDERIVQASLVNAGVDYASGTLELEIEIKTASGDALEFLVPVSTLR